MQGRLQPDITNADNGAGADFSVTRISDQNAWRPLEQPKQRDAAGDPAAHVAKRALIPYN